MFRKRDPSRSAEWRRVVMILAVLCVATVAGSLALRRNLQRANDRNVLGRCGNRICALSLALEGYHTLHPEALSNVVDSSGQGFAQSWRVAVLPYLEENELLEAYDVQQPWHSQVAQDLLSQCPREFRCQAHDGVLPPYATSYLAVVTPPTNGPQSIVMLTECSHVAIPWMDPQDITTEEFVAFARAELKTSPHRDHRFRVAVMRWRGATFLLQEGLPDEVLQVIVRCASGDDTVVGDLNALRNHPSAKVRTIAADLLENVEREPKGRRSQ